MNWPAALKLFQKSLFYSSKIKYKPSHDSLDGWSKSFIFTHTTTYLLIVFPKLVSFGQRDFLNLSRDTLCYAKVCTHVEWKTHFKIRGYSWLEMEKIVSEGFPHCLTEIDEDGGFRISSRPLYWTSSFLLTILLVLQTFFSNSKNILLCLPIFLLSLNIFLIYGIKPELSTKIFSSTKF